MRVERSGGHVDVQPVTGRRLFLVGPECSTCGPEPRRSATRRAGRAARARIQSKSGWTGTSRCRGRRPGRRSCRPGRHRSSTGVPAASASSCTWQVRSIVTNHQAASSTLRPTVSRPWLARIAALPSPRASAMRLPSSRFEHGARVVVEDGVVAVEGAGVLRQRIERAAQRRPRLAVRRVAVGGRHDVGAGGVDLRVDHERRRVQRPVALDDLALVVHEEQVLDPDVLEVHAERVDPEVVGQLGVAGGDVAGRALVEAEGPEDAEGGGEALLAVPALVLDACRTSGTGAGCGRSPWRRVSAVVPVGPICCGAMDFSLTEAERDLAGLCRDFAQKEIAAAGAARLGGGAVPHRPAPRDGRARPARHADPRGVGRHRHVHGRLRGGDGADRPGRPVGGGGVAGARDDRLVAAAPVRHRRPARALAAAAGRGPGARRVRPHRARRRLRRPGHHDPGRAPGRRLARSTGARRSSRTPAPTCPSA